MTDTERDSWPDEYYDPRDRPHPDTLRVTVEEFEDGNKRVLGTMQAVSDEYSLVAMVSFATVDDLWEVLTDYRLEILQSLVDTDGAAESITALAEELKRDYRMVHDDVSLLGDRPPLHRR